MDNELLSLDAASLYHLANWHEKQADLLRARAHDLASYKEMEARTENRIKYIASSPKTVRKYLRQGYSLMEAQKLSAETMSLPLNTIQKWWSDFCQNKDTRRQKERHRLILDLAELGLTNEKIGDRIGMHKNSVSRIINERKRERITFERNKKPHLALAIVNDEKPIVYNGLRIMK